MRKTSTRTRERSGREGEEDKYQDKGEEWYKDKGKGEEWDKDKVEGEELECMLALKKEPELE